MNILLIVTDQQSNRAMSCVGNPYLHTPHMDRLAASGARFEQAYCAAPVCGPSRACLLTGRMPHEHGVLVNGMPVVAGMLRRIAFSAPSASRGETPATLQGG